MRPLHITVTEHHGHLSWRMFQTRSANAQGPLTTWERRGEVPVPPGGIQSVGGALEAALHALLELLD